MREWILNVILRSVLGTIAIYFVNSWLAAWGVGVEIGLNMATVLTSGFLGFPGLLALYVLQLYKIL